MTPRRGRVRESPPPTVLDELLPAPARVLLTGGGEQFVERLGIEATRRAIHNVMMGQNLRTQTEPLSRRRIAQVSGALVALFAKGYFTREKFQEELSALAVAQLRSGARIDNASVWPAQWLIGLTGKSIQNVLRSKPEAFAQYITDFETAIREAASQCKEEYGDHSMTLEFVHDGKIVEVTLDWEGITRLTTAIGSQTLTIRGSDKSIYGKLFERLILGSVLTILGFERVNPGEGIRSANGVFWLSDTSDNRESDATLVVRPGKLARFDIGFIGPGNSEISKDKLSRYARDMELGGSSHSSVTFIIVDRLPKTGKTEEAAKKIGAEIVQMSMQYWPRELAKRLRARLGTRHALETMSDADVDSYLARELAKVPVSQFVAGKSIAELDDESNQSD